MIDLNVVFQVPDFIAEGLQNGTLERVGGVIRNSLSKKVVAWLKEGQAVQLESPSNELLQQMQSLAMSSNIALGLQVANLAVSVAGFALLYRKLNIIEGKIEQVREAVEQVLDGQQWQDEKQFLSMLAELKQGVRSIEELSGFSNAADARSKVLSVDDRVGRALDYFALVIKRIRERQECYKRADELALTYRAWIMAGQLSVQLMSAINERQLAHQRAQVLQSEHAEFGRYLVGQIQDTQTRVLKDNASRSGFNILKDVATASAQAHDILRGNTLQLELIKNEHLVLPPAQKGEDNRDGFTLYLIA
ncbi:hypothetical protein [Pseudomonas soli]|uniref:hypothetical protein n=1 Tax=Pseudomonas soli TaxID=1306993 RepID=UPI0028A95242|nr:hypothetical protein [Pseudomonas soli]